MSFFFFTAEWYSKVFMYLIFIIHSWGERYLDSLQVLPIANREVMLMFKQVFVE